MYRNCFWYSEQFLLMFCKKKSFWQRFTCTFKMPLVITALIKAFKMVTRLALKLIIAEFFTRITQPLKMSYCSNIFDRIRTSSNKLKKYFNVSINVTMDLKTFANYWSSVNDFAITRIIFYSLLKQSTISLSILFCMVSCSK